MLCADEKLFACSIVIAKMGTIHIMSMAFERLFTTPNPSLPPICLIFFIAISYTVQLVIIIL